VCSAAVLLRRVAYQTWLPCTIESTGMRIELQSTVVLASAMTIVSRLLRIASCLDVEYLVSSLAFIDPLVDIRYIRVNPDLEVSTAFFPLHRDPV
jgi:hypothetical protein